MKKQTKRVSYGWFPQEPNSKLLKTVSLKETFSERYKKALKLHRRERVWMAIANLVTLGFFAPSFSNYGERLGINWFSAAVLIAVLLLENTLIFWYYWKHPYEKEEVKGEG